MTIIENEDGTSFKDQDQRLKRWSQYFQQLYNQESETNDDAIRPLDSVPPEIISDPPSKDEIRAALTHMKNKAPGNDDITGEMLKAGGEETVEMLSRLLNQVWKDRTIPKDWKEALIIPIHKKGRKSKCQNYRGISLLSVPSKALSRILYERLYPTIDTILKDTQCGFRSGRSTADMIFTIRQVIEKTIEQERPLCIGFIIDISKAFDSVYRNMLMKVLENLNCPPILIDIIKSLYTNTTSMDYVVCR